MNLSEISLTKLYNSAVNAFPNTRRRQHLIEDIKIEDVKYTPFIGLKTLLIRANAHNTVENTNYKPIILFKNVDYNGDFNFIASDNNRNYSVARISENNALVRCTCGDEFWRFRHENKSEIDNSLYGPDRKPYYGVTPVNPTHSKGICKHLMAFQKTLAETGLVIL